MDQKICIITDTHFGADILDNTDTTKISTFGENIGDYKKFSDFLQDNSIDFLIHLGDISNRGQKNKYFYIKKCLQYLKCKKNILLPGNHDIPDLSEKEKRELGYTNLPLDIIIGNLHLIFLNIEMDGRLAFVPQKTLNYLENTLKKSQIQEKVVFCHYPCSEDTENISYYHIHRPERSFLQNAGELRKILETFQVSRYISGHTHFYFEKNIHGVVHTTLSAFSENNGTNKPNLSYALLDTRDGALDIGYL